MLRIRSACISLVIAATVLIGLNTAQAQFQVGPLVAYNIDIEEIAIGANAHIYLAEFIDNLPLIANPSFEYYLVGTEGVSFSHVAINALYPFELGGINVYGGGGLSIFRSTVTVPFVGSVSGSTSGLHVTGGATFGTGTFVPFADINIALHSGTMIALRGGVMFSL